MVQKSTMHKPTAFQIVSPNYHYCANIAANVAPFSTRTSSAGGGGDPISRGAFRRKVADSKGILQRGPILHSRETGLVAEGNPLPKAKEYRGASHRDVGRNDDLIERLANRRTRQGKKQN